MACAPSGYSTRRTSLESEEKDLETRAVRAGAQLWKVDLPICHFRVGTSKRFPRLASYLEVRNGIRYLLKHRPFWQTLLCAGCTFDIACNPFLFFFDPSNHAHRRTRGNRNLAAVGWNVLHLADTLRIRWTEGRRIAERRWIAAPPAVRP